MQCMFVPSTIHGALQRALPHSPLADFKGSCIHAALATLYYTLYLGCKLAAWSLVSMLAVPWGGVWLAMAHEIILINLENL